MTLEEFSSYAASRGMLTAENMAFGELRGYPFTLKAKGNPVQSITASFKLSQRLPKKALKSIKAALKGGPQGGPATGGKIFYFNYDPLLVGITCAGRDEGLWNRLFAAMDIAVQGFWEAGMTVVDQCPLCKQMGCDSLAYIGDGYVPVHKHCCEGQSYDAMAGAEANQNSGRYWSGILGAVLGGTIATIPTILLMYFAEMISAWLYALIPLGAYFGYRLCKGKMSRAVLPIVILIAVAELFFVQQVIWYLALHDEFGIWPYINESIAYFQMYVPLDIMFSDLIQPAIFTALGIFISYSQIRRNNHTESHSASLVLNSLFVKTALGANGAANESAAQPQTVEAISQTPQDMQEGSKEL